MTPVTPQTSRLRRSARLVAAAATRVLPQRQRAWGDSLSNEIAWIATDREALAWAIGGLRTAVVTRAVWLFETSLLIRCAVGAYALTWAIAPMWFVEMAHAYRYEPASRLQALASQTSLKNAAPFLHLFQYPVSLEHVSLLAAAMVVLGAGALVARRAGLAMVALMAAVMLFEAYWNVGRWLHYAGFEGVDATLWPLTAVLVAPGQVAMFVWLWAITRSRRSIS